MKQIWETLIEINNSNNKNNINKTKIMASTAKEYTVKCKKKKKFFKIIITDSGDTHLTF